MSEVDQEVEANPALDFVNAVSAGDFNNAEKLFNSILGDKVQDSLDAEKVSVADQIFNGAEPMEIDVTDDEVEAVLSDDFDESED